MAELAVKFKEMDRKTAHMSGALPFQRGASADKADLTIHVHFFVAPRHVI